jgi:hypothetical protein
MMDTNVRRKKRSSESFIDSGIHFLFREGLLLSAFQLVVANLDVPTLAAQEREQPLRKTRPFARQPHRVSAARAQRGTDCRCYILRPHSSSAYRRYLGSFQSIPCQEQVAPKVHHSFHQQHGEQHNGQ